MHRNRAKTVALAGLISVIIMVAGFVPGPVGLLVAVPLVTALNCYVFLRGDVIALRAMRAYPVGEAEQPVLYGIVRDVTVRAQVPMPSVYVSPTRAANAFATGRRPARSAVCCTEGLLGLLDERELRAVVGHELAHIRRRDTLTSSVVSALAGIVMLWFGTRASGRDGGPLLPGHCLLNAIGPIAATIVRAGTGSSREYEADADAARFTGDPLGLASALRKLDHSARHLVLPPERGIVAIAHVMVAWPLQRSGVVRLFSTHPPMADRVARLEQRAGYRR